MQRGTERDEEAGHPHGAREPHGDAFFAGNVRSNFQGDSATGGSTEALIAGAVSVGTCLAATADGSVVAVNAALAGGVGGALAPFADGPIAALFRGSIVDAPASPWVAESMATVAGGGGNASSVAA